MWAVNIPRNSQLSAISAYKRAHALVSQNADQPYKKLRFEDRLPNKVALTQRILRLLRTKYGMDTENVILTVTDERSADAALRGLLGNKELIEKTIIYANLSNEMGQKLRDIQRNVSQQLGYGGNVQYLNKLPIASLQNIFATLDGVSTSFFPRHSRLSLYGETTSLSAGAPPPPSPPASGPPLARLPPSAFTRAIQEAGTRLRPLPPDEDPPDEEPADEEPPPDEEPADEEPPPDGEPVDEEPPPDEEPADEEPPPDGEPVDEEPPPDVDRIDEALIGAPPPDGAAPPPDEDPPDEEPADGAAPPDVDRIDEALIGAPPPDEEPADGEPPPVVDRNDDVFFDANEEFAQADVQDEGIFREFNIGERMRTEQIKEKLEKIKEIRVSQQSAIEKNNKYDELTQEIRRDIGTARQRNKLTKIIEDERVFILGQVFEELGQDDNRVFQTVRRLNTRNIAETPITVAEGRELKRFHNNFIGPSPRSYKSTLRSINEKMAAVQARRNQLQSTPGRRNVRRDLLAEMNLAGN